MSEIEFELNSKCLAFHGPLLYEAKISKIHEPGSKKIITKDGEVDIDKLEEEISEEMMTKRIYYIHYKGWKNTWDEWVDSRRLKTYNVENLKLQKELKNAALTSTSSVSGISGKVSVNTSGNNKGGRNGSSSSTASGANSDRSKKKRSDQDLESEQDFLKRPEIVVLCPDILKELLVNDWELITKEHQLVSLPSKPTVSEIIKKYRTSLGKLSSSEDEKYTEFLSGLKIYFNRALGSILLYRFERQQYLDITKDPATADKDPCDIYGAEHLLRLIVSLPSLIAYTNLDQESIAIFKDQVENLSKFLEQNQKTFFIKHYQNVSPSYEALAKTV